MNLLFVRVVKANGTYVAPAFTPSGNELYSIYYAHILGNIPIGHKYTSIGANRTKATGFVMDI